MWDRSQCFPCHPLVVVRDIDSTTMYHLLMGNNYPNELSSVRHINSRDNPRRRERETENQEQQKISHVYLTLVTIEMEVLIHGDHTYCLIRILRESTTIVHSFISKCEVHPSHLFRTDWICTFGTSRCIDANDRCDIECESERRRLNLRVVISETE